MTNPSESTLVQPAAIGRRNFLRMLGMSAAAVVAAPSGAEAFLGFGRSAADIDLPGQWLREQGNIVRDYAEYIARLRLKNISVNQVLASHFKKRGRAHNKIPPKKLWKKIKPTLRAADKLADALDVPLTAIVSAYRSPRYNRACPGAHRRSFHMQNLALDLQFACSPRRVAHAARKLREDRVFRGGIGRYSTFTHIDTRGYNCDW